MSKRKKADTVSADGLVVVDHTSPKVTGGPLVNLNKNTGRAAFRWEGGTTMCISHAAFAMLAKRGLARRSGDIIMVGPYRCQVVFERQPAPGETEGSNGEGIYAERLHG